MRFDPRDNGLDCRIERDALRTKYEFMQVLAMPRFNFNARANIFGNKPIVEYDNIRQRV
jgi:hypothetical protein